MLQAGQKFSFLIEEEQTGTRIDVFLADEIQQLSRSHIQKLINEGSILVNKVNVKNNYKLKEEDQVEGIIPIPQPLEIKAENIPLNIVYEDQHLLVVNKPQGMVVHPAAGNYSGTLVNALMYHCQDLSGINGILRPGIVHRIDKDTSGLLLIAKNDQAHIGLAKQIKEHSVSRVYSALVHGVINEPGGIIDAPIGRDKNDRQKMAVTLTNSKNAVTEYYVQDRFKGYSLIEARLQTGRTHQIRVHMSYINHAVVGDPKYGPKKQHLGFKGQALHARLIGFVHPITKEYMEFSSVLPDYFQSVLQLLRKEE